MKQSMEFDNILNDCLERVLHGETVEQCLSRYPRYADRLKPLLDTGLQVKKAAAVQPRPEFRANARLQFQAALDASENRTVFSFLDWLKQPQWAAVTAFALLLVLGTTTAALANGSMPDQPLYPVKLAMEKIQISLTPSSESRGELYARNLERRVAEITRMASENKPDKIELVTTQLNVMVSGIDSSATFKTEDAARNAAPQVTAVPAIPPQPLAPTGPNFAAPANQTTPGIAATSPPMAGITGIPSPTDNATPPYAAGTANVALPLVGTDRLSVSSAMMLNNVAANLARLRDILASAPESERPALQNAIVAAENTYDALVKYLTNN